MLGSPRLNDRLRLRTPREKEDEAYQLGFVRQPSVRWLRPTLLAREGIQALISSAFGKFADKRESQTAPQRAFDYSSHAELGSRDDVWIDFLADTGDGWEATYTMAWLLAQPELPGPGDESLPRGDLLLLGGDQVYPSASPEAYRDRFTGPFASALPEEQGSGDLPHMFVTPGNHDWYDGLSSFLRVFCREGSIGGWRTRQRRSYYALKLPRRWWVFAIDIQLDTYIDMEQLEYFDAVAEDLREGDRVILISAKPSWVDADDGKLSPPSWEYLAYFERKVIIERGASLALNLTGDLHHYARYEPESSDGRQASTRITAGGGGAFLSATHHLRPRIELATARGESVPYRLAETYPSMERSRRRRWGVFALPFKTPTFGVMTGGLYTLFGLALLSALNVEVGRLVATVTADGVVGYLQSATSGTNIVLFVILAALLSGYADWKSARAKTLNGTLHALVHAAIVTAVVYLAALPFSPAALGVWAWVVAVPACAVAGYLLGSWVFALNLFLVHSWRGRLAPRHTNEVFACQGITSYRNFLRLRLARDGQLTVYPFGVERGCRRWDLSPAPGGPRFVPRGDVPEAALLERPRRLPAA